MSSSMTHCRRLPWKVYLSDTHTRSGSLTVWRSALYSQHDQISVQDSAECKPPGYRPLRCDTFPSIFDIQINWFATKYVCVCFLLLECCEHKCNFSWCFDVFIRQCIDKRYFLKGVGVRKRVQQKGVTKYDTKSWLPKIKFKSGRKYWECIPLNILIPSKFHKSLSHKIFLAWCHWLVLSSKRILLELTTFKLEQAIWDKETNRRRSRNRTPNLEIQPPSVAGDVTSHNRTMTILMTF